MSQQIYVDLYIVLIITIEYISSILNLWEFNKFSKYVKS